MNDFMRSILWRQFGSAIDLLGRAVNAGVTREEIAEALAIAMSVAAGSERAKYAPLNSKLEGEAG